MISPEGLIYIAQNRKSGKQYVGQTTDFKHRMWDYQRPGNTCILSRAFKKYGIAGFRFILVPCPTDRLNYWEMFFIDKLQSKCPNGYNLTDGGEGVRGHQWSDEQRMKKGDAERGKRRVNPEDSRSKFFTNRDRDEGRLKEDARDEINDWKGLGIPPNRARQYARQCDADELEFLSPSIAEMKMATRALENISHELSQRVWNERARELEKRVEREAVCVKCGKWTDRSVGEIENGLFYCGYCYAVCFGEKNTRWIPGQKE